MKKQISRVMGVVLISAFGVLSPWVASDALAQACVVPATGGTVVLPPVGCNYLSPQDVHVIINGLPAGTTIQLTGIHRDFVCNRGQGTPPGVCDFIPNPGCDVVGGAFPGGRRECADSSLTLSLHGTGTLGGWDRTINLPVSFETHVGQRTPNDPVQSFDTDMFKLQGQLPIGDPDFDLLRITAGTGFGMPSPGHTTLTRQGPAGAPFAVDSFFDIFYEIEFIGHPGGHLGGFQGSTTATIRMAIGPISCVPANCDDNNPCTTDACEAATGVCTHAAVSCDDGQVCTTDSCNPETGQCVHAPTGCDDGNACTNDQCVQALVASPPCIVPDNAGTVTLPPAGCEYLSPQDVHEIINGLPVPTTIQFGAIHKNFICGGNTAGLADCSFVPIPGVDCDTPGGALGGEKECSSSTLAMTLHGTDSLAGWNRTITIPVDFETHVGPRTPGAPIQSFDTDMYKLLGQITPADGDPDFDLLTIRAGTAFGMPSPGHTTLTRQGLPGSPWAVNSFFDIFYEIDFQGKTGGHVGGMSGSTTGTIRMQTGSGVGCTHTPTDCDDGNVCTADSCVPAIGCVHTPITCTDDNACTTDSCIQALVASPACVVPNNGAGTVTLPPAGCDYLSPQDVHEIINGLPPGTTIEFAAIHKDFICGGNSGATQPCSFVPPPGTCEQPGGALGGTEECRSSTLAMKLHGTGALGNFVRTINLPVNFETHVGPRTPGAPVQSFDTDMFQLQGQISPTDGDPDFDLLVIRAGTAFGMPSPGHTTLTQLPGGSFAVDSFFDIFYEIQFQGKPGGRVGGMSGTTRGTIRMQTGSGVGCTHTPTDCDDGNICTADSCNPAVGCVHTPISCNDNNACTTDSCTQAFVASPACVVPNNGGGTVTLPPAGCDYLSPQDVHEIINGLPPGTTIQFGAIHKDFICGSHPGAQLDCSFQPPPGLCEQPGGALGGTEECSGSTLAMSLHGTGALGTFVRMINLPVNFETHVGPRAPGAPVQSFDTDMFKLLGQITPVDGDPDFDLLIIRAGRAFGMPSPGHTTLTQLPGGNFAVDSFFDVFYEIQFQGKPGGRVGGMSGSTTGTIRMQTGSGVGCTHTPTDCDDGNICTADSCNPAIGCVHTAINCNDNDPCTTDSCVQALVASPACNVPNNAGTVTLPPAGCDYLSPQDVHEIINGLLPAGTTIEFGAIHKDFICGGDPVAGGCSFVPPPGLCEQPGGNLGGSQECSNSKLEMKLHGTGALAGWDRPISLPVKFETHVGARTPGAPVQSFATDMFHLEGQIIGDPDFDLLRIRAGTDFGMPSPGHTTLTRQPNGTFNVDSFFDVFYEIYFEGSPGGHVPGRSGSTTGTIRMQTGSGVGCVHTTTNCDDGNACTEDSCTQAAGCVHLPISCNDNNACTTDSCNPASGCVFAPISCLDNNACTTDSCNPTSGCVHTPTNCSDGDACTADSCVQTLVAPACIVPDNGGTVTLPPAGCDYLSPQDVHQIVAGLPPGTTIELGAIHKNFICRQPPKNDGVCTFVPPPGFCEQPGGTLGGREECNDSQVQMNLHGTGVLAGFNRTIQIDATFETHVGPRAPGAPVQSFDTDMFRLRGQLPIGDPDFDLLRITAGTGFGLPSPGHTTLTRQGPAGSPWAVDSFFDITYRIDFIGKTGGPLSGMSGSTTATIRMQTGSAVGCVHTPIVCNDNNPCTNDSCASASGCVFTNNTATCNDNNPCTVGDICGGGTCNGTTITAPAETQNVLAAANKTIYTWNPAALAVRYDVVRGSVSSLPVGPGGGDEVCFDDLQGPTLTDAQVPDLGAAFFYLSRGENTCGNGTFGQRSNGAQRITTTCP